MKEFDIYSPDSQTEKRPLLIRRRAAAVASGATGLISSLSER